MSQHERDGVVRRRGVMARCSLLGVHGAAIRSEVSCRRVLGRITGLGLLALGVFWTPWLRAEGRVVTISEVTIVGRVQKPIAAVDVSRIQPKLTLAELKQNFSDKIEKALYRAPF